MTELIIGSNVIKGELNNFTIADTSIFRFKNDVEVSVSGTPPAIINMFRGAYGQAFSLDKIRNATVDFNNTKITMNRKDQKKKSVVSESGARLDKVTGFTQPPEPRHKPAPLITSKITSSSEVSDKVSQKEAKKPVSKKTSKV